MPNPARTPAPVGAADILWVFLRLRGRLGRAAFLLAFLLLALAVAFPLYRLSLAPEGSAEAQGWSSAFTLAFLAAAWSNLALGVKRFHDLGKPGVAAASLFVPVVSIVAFAALCVVPGDRGPNAYGERTDAPD